MIVSKKDTSGETAQNGPGVVEMAFGKNLSSLRMALAAVTVAVSQVNLGLVVM